MQLSYAQGGFPGGRTICKTMRLRYRKTVHSDFSRRNGKTSILVSRQGRALVQ